MSIDGVLFISCFLPLLLAIHWLIPGEKARNYILLAAGLIFCAFGSLSGLVLLMAMTGLNYLLGRAVMADRKPKLCCALAVVADLGILIFFKYLDFLLSQVLGLPQMQLGLAAPLGISFYTFKCIAYIVDTYRNREQGTKSFSWLLLYTSFFPQLTAGPISRFGQFRGCLTGRQWVPEKVACGLRRFVLGLGKKLLLAGTLAKITDGVFGLMPEQLNWLSAWLGAVSYMLQLYFDFSGYSDMAIGLGAAFGFETPENFRYPYSAWSVGDFWRRWHISLSSWFKDYLYIPLGGNRHGKARAALNKALVFLFCGIWHGADWTFLVWGLWHGLFSALESAGTIRPKKGLLSRIYTLLVVCLGFVIFRAASLSEGFFLIRAMFTGFGGSGLPEGLLTGESILAFAVAGIFAQPVTEQLKNTAFGRRVLEPASWGLVLILFVLCLSKLASGGFVPFIYAQF